MIRPPPGSNRPDIPLPYSTRFRSAAVERVLVQPRLGRPEAFDRPGHPLLQAPSRRLGLLDRDGGEAHRVTRAHAAEPRDVGRDHGAELRIAAGGLVIGQQHDRPAVARNLARAGGDTVGDDVVATRMREHRAVEAHAHARSVEHTSDLTSLLSIPYAVF